MNARRFVDRVLQHEGINFLLTNRIPRRLVTRLVGWFSGLEQPVVRRVSIAALQFFAGDLSLHESKKTTFTSLHDCFIRELKDGARPIAADPKVLVSPCDAIVGASGPIEGLQLVQAKGSFYRLDDLLGGNHAIERYLGGRYVTLRLTSNMYHRFHAPYDCAVDEVTYISGDTWNVNPITLKRITQLYCKNERAVIHARLLGSAESILLVPVAAILVASIHLHFIDVGLNLEYNGPNRIPCDAHFHKGDELGYFHHGSTIIVVATPGLTIGERVQEGEIIRMGEPLFHLR
jgi:phosphatidylserine decarboxylase